MTDTLVSNDKARIKDFLARIGGRGVIKPLHGAGGEGVFALDPRIRTSTRSSRR